MTLTRQEETALIIVSALAQTPGVYVRLSDIKKRYGVSLPFLKKIARMLRHHGIIISREGLHGGYQLKIPGADMSVLQVLKAVGGKTLDDGSFQAPSRVCPLAPDCIPQKIRSLITANLIAYLSDVTMDQFLMKERKI